jgi:UDP-2-acetamido-3-amino-2,3-dideoxy-glucuronate N-acetyltransferase
VIDPSARIHATADLEDDVSIGPGTIVGPGAHLRAGVRVGAGCLIGPGVFIDLGVTVGDHVRIEHAALLYRGSTVEDGVLIGPAVILAEDRYPRVVATSADLRPDDGPGIEPIVLRSACSVGAGAIVLAGVEVGRFATVGAGAVVTRSVAGHGLVVGSPAHRIGWVCACGVRLQGSAGQPAGATPALYAQDRDLHCLTCVRRYRYVADVDTLVELPAGLPQGAPA